MRAFSGFLACVFVVLPSSIAVAEERPNIIFVMTDDLGYGDLGCYGQKVVKTPHLDRMAEEGLRFTDHYAGHTVCRPSRLSLWVGQHVGHTGLQGNKPRNLTGSELTVAKRLKAAGYATGGVGKWALGNVDTPAEINNSGHPNRNGFDFWFGYLNQSNAHNYYPPFLWRNSTQVPLSGNVLMDDPAARGRVSREKVTYSHDVITQAAFEFIRENHAQPFLLHIHWTIPHANNEAGRVLKNGMEVPNYGIYAQQAWPDPEKGFAAMVSYLDRDMGRLLALLKELNIDQKTLLLFTSDNGPHSEGNHDHEFFNSNGSLRGYKRSMYEGGIRVPLIARWPGKIMPGAETAHPSAHWDFLPTACEIAGAERSPEATVLDGISYLPTLLGKAAEQPEHEYLYWASDEGETSVGVRHRHWKLVKTRHKRRSATPTASNEAVNPDDWQLFNLRDDIGEEHDLAKQHPQLVAEILSMLRRDQL
ncbi:arylsulfatase [Planctomycetaceae bacterium SH139]